MPKTMFKRCLNKLAYGLTLTVADLGAFVAGKPVVAINKRFDWSFVTVSGDARK